MWFGSLQILFFLSAFFCSFYPVIIIIQYYLNLNLNLTHDKYWYAQVLMTLDDAEAPTWQYIRVLQQQYMFKAWTQEQKNKKIKEREMGVAEAVLSAISSDCSLFSFIIEQLELKYSTEFIHSCSQFIAFILMRFNSCLISDNFFNSLFFFFGIVFNKKRGRMVWSAN